MARTNAMRLLDAAHIKYREAEYASDENDLSGKHVSKQIGLSDDEVFKTLVTKGDKNGINVFCVPVSGELNLKKAAFISGNKKIEMIAVKDILQITGYIRGGCSPVGMKKRYPTFIDETAVLFDEIAISAGVRGSQIIINGETLCEFIEGKLCDLI